MVGEGRRDLPTSLAKAKVLCSELLTQKGLSWLDSNQQPPGSLRQVLHR